MQASIKNDVGLQRTVTVTIDAETVSGTYDKIVRQLMKNVRLDGFRKGHVPRNIIISNFKTDVITRTIESLFTNNMPKALAQCEVKPAGMPKLVNDPDNPLSFDENEDFTFQAAFEVVPEDLEFDFEQLEFTQLQSSVMDEDIDRMIENLRDQRAFWETVDDRTAELGDRVIIDFKGQADGQDLKGLSANGFIMVLDYGHILQSFIDPIVGHKEGDEFSFEVPIPENYDKEEMRGKTAVFNVKLQNVAVKRLPEVNADFIKSYRIKDGTIESFRKELRTNMEREQARVLRARNHDLFFDTLLKSTGKFAIPECWVEETRVALCKSEDARLQSIINSADYSNFEENKELMREAAEHAVRTQWIAAQLKRSLNVKEASREAVDAELNLLAGAYENPEEVKKALRKDKQQFKNIMHMAVADDVLKLVLAKSKVKTEDISFSELIYGKSAQ